MEATVSTPMGPWLGRLSLNIQEKVKSQLGKWAEGNFSWNKEIKAFVLPNCWLHSKCYIRHRKEGYIIEEYNFHNDKFYGEHRIRRNKFYIYKDDYVRTVIYKYHGKALKEEHYDEDGLAEGVIRNGIRKDNLYMKCHTIKDISQQIRGSLIQKASLSTVRKEDR